VYVAPVSERAHADGTLARPWPSIQRAVNAAPDGATIVIRGGRYHESVSLSGKHLTLQPYRREHVWLTGSKRIRRWLPEGAVWRSPGWTHIFDREPAFDALDPQRPLAAWPEMVFLDGHALRQVAHATDVASGTFYVDLAHQALLIGSDPAGRTVEASTLERALTIRNAAGSVVRGIGVRRYATPFDQVAAVAGFSDRLTFDRVISQDNATNGLSLIGAGSQVTRSAFRRNGQIGLHAHRVFDLSLTGNWMQANNVEGFRQNFAQGGIKVTRGSDMTWEGNLISDNYGDGMWCDISCTDVRIVKNVVAGNNGRGIKYEISARGVIASNRIIGNAGGVLVNESSEVLVYNNVIRGARIGILALAGSRSGADGAVPQDVLGVVLRNNIVGSTSPGKPLLALRGAHEPPRPRRIDADFDVFVVPTARPGHTLFQLPSRDGPSVVEATSLASLRAETGQEVHGKTVVDVRSVDQSSPRAALPTDVAAALGVEPGTRVPPGLLGDVPPAAVLDAG